jgi:hypothetical protein
MTVDKSRRASGLLRILAGTGVHLVFCLFGSTVLTLVVSAIIGAVSPWTAKGTELVVPVLAGALLASFAAPRWFHGSAPLVGIFGLLALFVGGLELYRGWSPTWSHQTRHDYVLSQLFGSWPGCSDSECLYLLFFGYPFLCLTTYGVASVIALALSRKDRANN